MILAIYQMQLTLTLTLKVIQTIRNPKDTLVSYYHHIRNEGHLGAFNGTWDQYFEKFKETKLPWGDYFQTNVEWFEFNKDRENSLILTYEEMQKDKRANVIKIAKFIGRELAEEAVDLIVEKSSIKEVRKKFAVIQAQGKHWNSERCNFIRKGEVGDWVNYFSKEQSDLIDNKCKEYLEPLGLHFEYKI